MDYKEVEYVISLMEQNEEARKLAPKLLQALEESKAMIKSRYENMLRTIDSSYMSQQLNSSTSQYGNCKLEDLNGRIELKSSYFDTGDDFIELLSAQIVNDETDNDGTLPNTNFDQTNQVTVAGNNTTVRNCRNDTKIINDTNSVKSNRTRLPRSAAKTTANNTNCSSLKTTRSRQQQAQASQQPEPTIPNMPTTPQTNIMEIHKAPRPLRTGDQMQIVSVLVSGQGTPLITKKN